MTRGRGIVMEVRGRRAIVLTPGGEFKKVPLWGGPVDVGQEIVFSCPPERAGLRVNLRAALVAAAVLLLVTVPGLVGEFVFSARPVAYVSVDINPSIELAIDSREKVVSVEALNEEGGEVVESLSLQGLGIEQAIRMIVEEAIRLGYFGAGEGRVVITTAPVAGREKTAEKIEARVQEKVEETVSRLLGERGLPGQVQTLRASAKVRLRARELEMSVGRYIVLLEAQEEGLDIGADELRLKGIGRALREYGVKPGELIGRAQKRESFEEIMEQFQERVQGVGKDKDKDRDKGDGEPGWGPGRNGKEGRPGTSDDKQDKQKGPPEEKPGGKNGDKKSEAPEPHPEGRGPGGDRGQQGKPPGDGGKRGR